MTLGDVTGIGPEVVACACTDSRIRAFCDPLVVGHPDVLRRALQLIDSPCEVVPIDVLDRAEITHDRIACFNPANDDAADLPPGRIDPRAGRAAYEYLAAATRAALAGRVDAIVTAPLNKAALNAAGIPHPGHTEILAELCGSSDFAMMLYLPAGPEVRSPHGLGVAHVTLHTSIASVPGLLSVRGIQSTVELLDRFMRRMGAESPRIGVCALNPHAGERGLFGDEEQRLIAPAVAAARTGGIQATGPIPADALLRRAVQGEFDGVAAMYHDQGHIALKLVAFEKAVNVTLGLPIIRTSPSHGTAFDIAWKGQARAEGMIEAVRVATLLARSRAEHKVPGG